MLGNSWHRIRFGILFLFAFMIYGCAGKGVTTRVTDDNRPGKKEVPMIASNFDFEPSVIQALRGDTLVLKISNVSSGKHNITIKDPHQEILKSVELPGNETVSVEIGLKDKGVYEFWCDKAFHTTFGMKGRIEAN